MSRPRLKKNRGYVENVNPLYHPKTRKLIGHYYVRPDIPKGQPGHTKSLKTASRIEANKAGKRLNEMLMPANDIVKKVLHSHESAITLNRLLENVFKDWEAKTTFRGKGALSESTVGMHKRYANILKTATVNGHELGKLPINGIGPRMLSIVLRTVTASQQVIFATVMRKIFAFAIKDALIDTNPADSVVPDDYRKSALRLTYPAFLIIREFGRPFFQRAMDLALVSLQRRSDLIRIKWRHDASDPFPCYTYTQDKKIILHIDEWKKRNTVHRKKKDIDTNWRIDIHNMSIRDALDACRDDVASPYVLHFPADHRKSTIVGTPFSANFLTSEFADVRDRAMKETGLFLTNHHLMDHDGETIVKNPTRRQLPTWHQIRSTGTKCYEDEGKNPQSLLGHEGKEMTEGYKRGHELRTEFVPADQGNA